MCGVFVCVRYVGDVIIIKCVCFSLCVISCEFFSGLLCSVILVWFFSRLIMWFVSVMLSDIFGWYVRNVGIIGSNKCVLIGIFVLMCNCFEGCVLVEVLCLVFFRLVSIVILCL